MYEGNSQIELKRFTSVYWHAIQSINQSINKLYLNTVNGSASWFSDMHLIAIDAYELPSNLTDIE